MGIFFLRAKEYVFVQYWKKQDLVSVIIFNIAAEVVIGEVVQWT